MNSRDAAYDEEKYHALIDLPKADLELPPRTPISAVSVNGALNGFGDLENEPDVPAVPKKKRKRSEEDA